MLTCDAYFKLVEKMGSAGDPVDFNAKDGKFTNELYGLGGNCTVYRPPPRVEDAGVEEVPGDDYS